MTNGTNNSVFFSKNLQVNLYEISRAFLNNDQVHNETLAALALNLREAARGRHIQKLKRSYFKELLEILVKALATSTIRNVEKFKEHGHYYAGNIRAGGLPKEFGRVQEIYLGGNHQLETTVELGQLICSTIEGENKVFWEAEFLVRNIEAVFLHNDVKLGDAFNAQKFTFGCKIFDIAKALEEVKCTKCYCADCVLEGATN